MHIESVTAIFRHNMSTLARDAAASRRASRPCRPDDTGRTFRAA